jgi:hypothetical protein
MPTRREGNILSDTNATEGRRQLLKAIALGGGAVVAVKILPESWTTPVIDTVMLPVHAQASGAGGDFVLRFTDTVLDPNDESATFGGGVSLR